MQGPLDGCNSWSWWWSLGFVLVVYGGCQVNSSISRLVRLPMARIGCNLGIWATHHFETLREETQHFFWHYRKELLQMELFVLTSVVFFVRKGFCVEFWLVIVFYKNMLFPNFHPRPLCSRSPPQKKNTPQERRKQLEERCQRNFAELSMWLNFFMFLDSGRCFWGIQDVWWCVIPDVLVVNVSVFKSIRRWYLIQYVWVFLSHL